MPATQGNDELTGGSGPDNLNGLGGDDKLSGLGGDDILDGGAGEDLLLGGTGSDKLTGGDDDDQLEDLDTGSDTLVGGSGDDVLRVYHFPQSITTGPLETIRAEGGAGNDRISLHSRFAHDIIADGGEGNDRFDLLGPATRSVLLTLGAGSDRIDIGGIYQPLSLTSFRIKDFETGQSGDQLWLPGFLYSQLTGWTYSKNPFATGHLRMVQRNADSVLQIDRSGGADSFTDLIIFENVAASSFTANNLGGYPTNGGTPGLTLVGTDADDSFEGFEAADQLQGRGGNDVLAGFGGNDTLYGGDGDDVLDDPYGSNRFFGGEGNDRIIATSTFGMANSLAQVDGGAGDDRLDFRNRGNLASLTANMGDGNDFVEIGSLTGTILVTLGAGTDTLKLSKELYDQFDNGKPVTITDFTPGNAGDRIELLELLELALRNWDRVANPFATGHLKLSQSGADTLLRIDPDGGGNSYHVLVVFKNSSAASFTGYNLGRFPPDGSPPLGDHIVGTEAGEVLDGTPGGDLIEGLGGFDLIDGLGGNDKLLGGDGDDRLDGGAGDDVLGGGAGNDELWDHGEGDVTANGADGDDTINLNPGAAIAGDKVTVAAGAGKDSLVFQAIAGDSLVADMGEGDDHLLLLAAKGGATLTLGAGADVIELSSNPVSLFSPITIMDFGTGAGGDRLDLANFMRNAEGLEPWQNPFATGHLRLVQSGSSALLQLDLDGSVGPKGFRTLFTFRNSSTSEFTTANLGGYPPDGGPIPGVTRNGDGTDEFFVGSYGPDLIRGYGGNDFISGLWANDRLYGGDGDDEIVSGEGNDLVLGGAGHDRISDEHWGSDSIHGEDGDDTILLTHQDLTRGAETVAIDAGAGNDGVSVTKWTEGALEVLLADGADHLTLRGLVGTVELSLGSGSDRIAFTTADGHPELSVAVTGRATVADFTTAAGGDIFSWTDLSGFLQGEILGVNPMASGHLQLTSRGTDTLLQVDRDGGGDDWVTLFVFSGTKVSDFSKANFAGHPNVIKGTTVADKLAGTDQADLLWGMGGNDVLNGAGGADLMDGGPGDDLYIANHEQDRARERADGGIDTVRSQVSHVLGNHVENLVLLGTGAIDGTGNGIANRITGNSASNRIDGGGGADLMEGGAGNDSYRVDLATDRIVETASGGTDTVLSLVSFRLPAFIERLTLEGSANLNATGNVGANIIKGNGGNNVLDGGVGADRLEGGFGDDSYLVDNPGDLVIEHAREGGSDTVRSSVSFTLGQYVDRLVLTGTASISGTGNDDPNLLVGNDGANRLDGGAGDDVMRGGKGDDIYVIGFDSDKVEELAGEGRDTVLSSGNHVLAANLENLTLTGANDAAGTGNGGANILKGNSATNRLDGGGGADRMEGGAGGDTYVVDNVGDVVIETIDEIAVDTIASKISYVLPDKVEGLALIGTAAIDGTGNSATNAIVGNVAANRLDGRAGADALAGGPGADIFQFSTALGGDNIDFLADFSSAEDSIWLDRNIFSAFGSDGALPAGAFATGAAADFDDRIIFDQANGLIYYDPDGIGAAAAILFAEVDFGVVVTAADFAIYTGA